MLPTGSTRGRRTSSLHILQSRDAKWTGREEGWMRVFFRFLCVGEDHTVSAHTFDLHSVVFPETRQTVPWYCTINSRK